MKEKWHDKNIKEFFNKNIEIIVASILAPIIIFLYYYYNWWTWKWENVEVIKFTLLTYAFVSALTFKWPWRVLHDLFIYKTLSIFSSSRKEYKESKKTIWMFLNFLTAAWFIYITNLIASILFNLFTFTVYLLPSILIIIAIVIIYYWYFYFKNKKTTTK